METPQKTEINVHAAQERAANVPKKDTLGLTAGDGVIMWPCLSLWPRLCREHFGTDADREVFRKMDG